MTSGNFEYVPLSSIKIDRASRQRKEVGDVSDLADSINRLGLIHPIVVDRRFYLIAGERRLEAHRLLDRDVIAVQWAEDLTPSERRAIELEENVKRKDISWQEQSLAIKEYHAFRKETQPDWTLEKTAGEIGYSLANLKNYLQVGEALASGKTRVAEAPRFSTAKGILQREASRADAATLAAIASIEDAPTAPDLIETADFLGAGARLPGVGST